MECIVCKNLERDIRDIQRRITERTIDQQRVKTTTEKKNIGFELGALAATISEIEGRYLKHRNSAMHQEAAGTLLESRNVESADALNCCQNLTSNRYFDGAA